MQCVTRGTCLVINWISAAGRVMEPLLTSDTMACNAISLIMWTPDPSTPAAAPISLISRNINSVNVIDKNVGE
jgi:hypothetical protein